MRKDEHLQLKQLYEELIRWKHPKPEERQRRYEEARKKALGAFPYATAEVPGADALATWRRLGASKGLAAVIAGDLHALFRVAEHWGLECPGPQRSTRGILKAASRLQHPRDLIRLRTENAAKKRKDLLELLEREPVAQLLPLMRLNAAGKPRKFHRDFPLEEMLTGKEPEVGEWPQTPPDRAQPEWISDTAPSAHLVVIPTDDWTTIPAFLRWGGWNDCPDSEYHVAALRSWRDRFGAELVELGVDRMRLRVAKRPRTRARAMELARELYEYCHGAVIQGEGTFSALAARLMHQDWWYFWWD